MCELEVNQGQTELEHGVLPLRAGVSAQSLEQSKEKNNSPRPNSFSNVNGTCDD